ncbi:MAG TPA: CxxxxCH/CxxCH domain-containing protein, partial [Candidatus Methanoperedens sp.]|nr:CxxxxCH/CxxCH domain-containing protein [Candidatus Methanoperedens sp.]
MRRPWRRFLFAAVLLAAVGVLLFAGKTLDAGVGGSPHDFSSISAIAPSGVCSACHIPHGADVYGLWTRDLTLYRTKLGMDGSLSSEPNYVHAPTIQCYDCHDSHDDTTNRIDAVPAKTDFSAGHYPQNIAFGFTKINIGSMTEDSPAGSVPGYYENKPPYSTSPSSNYGADPNLNPAADNAQLLKTGGHYFKYVDPDGGTTTFKKGDKLPCRDCHDPHAWDSQWQAFFRKSWPTTVVSQRLGTTVRASSYMANNTGIRDANGGRNLCTSCHGNSDTLNPVNLSDINAQYVSTAIVRPSASIAEHANANTTTPCVSCHGHNSVDVSCGECHGYPPPQYPANRNPEGTTVYAVTPERTHAVHFGKQNGSGTAFSKYSFQCSICHANSAMGTKTPSNHGNDNVDVDFDLATLATTRAWIDTVPLGHPARFQPFTGSAYTRTTCGPGGRGGVYCHSAGHDNTAVDPAVYYRNVTWGTAPLKCFGCHGNAAYDNANIRYGMPDNTADHANSHPVHVVANGYECSVCHFNTVTGTAPLGSRAIKGTTNSVHVNGNTDVDFDSVVVTGTPSYTRATKTCSVSCHGSATPQWGGTIAGCSGCHLSSSPDSDVYLNYTTTNNIYDANQAGNINTTEWLYSGHGKVSPGTYDVSGRPAANFVGGDPCYFCHDPYVAHDNATNPFRLKDQTGAAVYLSSKGWNATCLVCHFHSTTPIGYNPFGAYVKAIAAFTDNAHYGPDHVAAGTNGGKFCWDCHDPHGDRPSSDVNNIYMIQGGSNRTAPAVGTLLKQSDGTYGFRGTTANALTTNAPVFIAASTGTHYVDNTNVNKNGICQVCHTTADHWKATVNGDGHNAGIRCTQCHTHDTGFAPSGCNGCHGGGNNTPATGTNAWPDSNPSNAYYDRNGRHVSHVDAISQARFGSGATVDQKNTVCDTCHPSPGAGSHHSGNEGSGAYASAADLWNDVTAYNAGSYKNMSGAPDADGSYAVATKKCSNIDCHGGTITPAWYVDTSAPVFSPNNVISVTNPNTDGELSISWPTATDAGTPPVRYDLYRQAGTVPNACITGTVIASNLGTTGYIDNALVNGNTYSYCVRAKDSVTPTPYGDNTTTAQGTPTAPAAPSPVVYRLVKSNSITVATGVTTNISGNCTTAEASGTMTAGAPPPHIGLLAANYTCSAASNNNYTPLGAPTNGTYRWAAGYYLNTAYGTDTTVTGSATGNSFMMRGSDFSAPQENVGVYLAAVNSGGVHTLSTNYGQITNVGTTYAAKTPAMNTVSIQVPTGSKLAVIFQWADTSTTSSTNDQIGVDNSGTGNYITFTESLPADTTPPTFGGLTSAADAITGGAVTFAWTAATDPSAPVRYTVYAVQSSTLPAAATLFQAGNIVQNNITGTSTTVSGLTNGLPYFFGVRATDLANNTETNTAIRPSAVPGVIPTSSGAGSGCTTCHGTPPTTGAHLKHATTDSVYTDCDKCHGDATYSVSPAAGGGYTTAGPSGLHNNGSKSMYFLRIPGETTDAGFNADNTCSNVDCHFNNQTPNWYTGSTNCSSCHGYPPVNTAGIVDHDLSRNDSGTLLKENHDDCTVCHGIKNASTHANYPSGSHGDGVIRMNGPDSTPGPAAGAQYDDSNGGCNKACHLNDTSHRLGTSTTRNVNYGDFGSNDCTSCHKAGGSASFVTVNSTHVKIRRSDAGAALCTACHPGNLKGGFHAKNADANVVAVPNYTQVGINYSHTVDTGITGYVLGGDNTTGTTEAEICWNCHDTNTPAKITEWETSTTDTNGTYLNYNYGVLHNNTGSWGTRTRVSSWFTGYWDSATFRYKTGKLTDKPITGGATVYAGSTHTANPSGAPWNGPTGPGVDTVAQVRCSYCHDVHGRRVVWGGGGTPPASAAPFLRGTWMGNPYKEDGAPRFDTGADQHTYTNLTGSNYGLVPRKCPAATAGAMCDNATGGYQIDQNSWGAGNYLSSTTWAPNNAAGICALCHSGPASTVWTATAIDAINQFGTPGTDWVSGFNSHKAVVKGGTATSNFNLFDENRRHPITGYPVFNTQTANAAFRYYPLTSYKHMTGSSSQAQGFRGGDGLILPPQTSNTQPYAYTDYGWQATPDNTSNQNAYHQFPCS